jgi:hypothetical protein
VSHAVEDVGIVGTHSSVFDGCISLLEPPSRQRRIPRMRPQLHRPRRESHAQLPDGIDVEEDENASEPRSGVAGKRPLEGVDEDTGMEGTYGVAQGADWKERRRRRQSAEAGVTGGEREEMIELSCASRPPSVPSSTSRSIGARAGPKQYLAR